MSHSKHQQGFTAVELLVTLFVAAAFLIAGYQLFSLVVRDGGKTRAEAKASAVAYDYLRRHSAAATSPCSSVTPVNNETVTVQGLSNVQVTVSIDCAKPNLTSLSQVNVQVTFNNPVEVVRYSTYVTK